MVSEVTFTRDFPRLGAKVGQKADLLVKKGEDMYEVSFYNERERKRFELVVLREWIEPDPEGVQQ